MKIADPDPHPDPDPLVRGMDPRIRIRIHPKITWIRHTKHNPLLIDDRDNALKSCQMCSIDKSSFLKH